MKFKRTACALMLSAVTLPVTIGMGTVPAMAAVRQINCSQLSGAGTFTNPLRIGRVTTTTVVVGCPRLTSGTGFNHRYYSFSLSRTAPSGSAIGAVFTITPTEMSAVHPRLSSTSGVTIADSLRDGFWVGQFPTFGRYLPISPLNRYNRPLPAGNWIMGVEKLDSPLRSVRTPNFNLVIYFWSLD